MVLDGENDGVVTGHEGVIFDGLDDVQEPDLAGDGVAVEDEGHPLWPVPAVQLYTATTHPENSADVTNKNGMS